MEDRESVKCKKTQHSILWKTNIYLTIRQRGRVVYGRIVNEDEVRVDYSLIDNYMPRIVYVKKILQKPQQNASFLQWLYCFPFLFREPLSITEQFMLRFHVHKENENRLFACRQKKMLEKLSFCSQEINEETLSVLRTFLSIYVITS